jgi:hypothetical protein
MIETCPRCGNAIQATPSEGRKHVRGCRGDRQPNSRTVRLTPKGNHAAFLIALERIYAIPQGGVS